MDCCMSLAVTRETSRKIWLRKGVKLYLMFDIKTIRQNFDC